MCISAAALVALGMAPFAPNPSGANSPQPSTKVNGPCHRLSDMRPRQITAAITNASVTELKLDVFDDQ